MAFCTKCGGKLNEGAKFCGNCGNPMGGSQPNAGSPAKEQFTKFAQSGSNGKQKLNNFFERMPFKKMAYDKIPAETITKFPILGKVMPYANQIVSAFAAALVITVLSSIGGGLVKSANAAFGGGGSSSKSSSGKFGSYPAGYEIAYFNLVGRVAGFSTTPTVKDLFGADAPFLTDVTFEIIKVTGNEFEASIKSSLYGMDVKFQSDKKTEKSYLRYVRFTMLGITAGEERSDGSEREDMGILAYFLGIMSQAKFWDTSKFKD
jgi:hypothetical protein